MARLIFEGCDKTGKTTLISEILKKLPAPHPVVHFTAPPAGVPSPQIYQNQGILEGIKLLKASYNIVFDRFAGGEYVYGYLKRRYTNPFALRCEEYLPKDTLLIVLSCNDETILKRFDDRFITRAEIPKVNQRFKNYFHESKIKHKVLINTDMPVEDCVDKIMKAIEKARSDSDEYIERDGQIAKNIPAARGLSEKVAE